MNPINEKLRIIKTQKTAYYKEMKKTSDQQKLYELSKKIQKLDHEEYELLKTLNVDVK